MRCFLLLVSLIVFVSPVSAQQLHWIEPGKVDTFSVCIREDCIEPAWPVANMTVTVFAEERSWLRVDLSCRHTDTNSDTHMARGTGWQHIKVAAQFAPQFYRWCNITINNRDDQRVGYRIRVDAVREGEWRRNLWPGNKRTGDYSRGGDNGNNSRDDDDNNGDDVDPRFNNTLWSQLVYNAYDKPIDLSGRRSLVLSEPMNVYIRTTDENGDEAISDEWVNQVGSVHLRDYWATEFTGRQIINEIHFGPDDPGERIGWILIRPFTDQFQFRDLHNVVTDNTCGLAGIGANPGLIQISVEPRCVGDPTKFASMVAHELGHSLGFFHVDPDEFPGSTMMRSYPM